MNIAINIDGNTASIILKGNIDYFSRDGFTNAQAQILETKGVNEIRVDFTQVSFIDSSGISGLLKLHKSAKASGKTMIVINCSETIKNIFKIGGFDSVLNIE